MSALLYLDQKITLLQKKREHLSKVVGLNLLKKIEATLGKDFSPEMALGLIIETWKQSTPEQHKKWQDQGALFFRQTSRKSTQKNHPDTGSKPEAPSQKKTAHGS